MLTGKERNEFFHNIHNKETTIAQTTKYFVTNGSNKDKPFFINDGDSMYQITEIVAR